MNLEIVFIPVSDFSALLKLAELVLGYFTEIGILIVIK